MAGFFDGASGRSSKRLESFIGLGAAIAVAGVGLAIGERTITPILVGAFLGYSAAMQGVSAISEKGKGTDGNGAVPRS